MIVQVFRGAGVAWDAGVGWPIWRMGTRYNAKGGEVGRLDTPTDPCLGFNNIIPQTGEDFISRP